MSSITPISNFGRNVTVKPSHYYEPSSEAELLEILTQHRSGQIRVMGAKHSWSPLIQTQAALVNMKNFNRVEVNRLEENTYVTIGAGCQIKNVLKILSRQGLTLPSVGLITEQTIAGAIATGTHGSGKHCLSHYVTKVQLACYAQAHEPQIIEITDGPELRAAQCSLGAMGVMVSVTLPCVPQYYVQEKSTACNTIDEVLALEKKTPLQQFFLIPHSWTYFVQQRQVAKQNKRAGAAWLYRLYWFWTIDVGLHLSLITFAVILRSSKLVQFLYRRLLPSFLFQNWVVTDRSDRQLVMENELFSHLEMEVFVKRSDLRDALDCIIDLLKLGDDPSHQINPQLKSNLINGGLWNQVTDIKGCHSHHYPICCRRIQPDQTMLSMTSGADEDWYSISLITYTYPRETFYTLAQTIAKCLFYLFEARLHWGKWFPLEAEQVRQQYPDLEHFRQICQYYDPSGVFQNTFVQEKCGFRQTISVK